MDFINTLIFTLPWPFPLVTIFLLMVLMGIGAYYGKALNFSGTVAAVTTGTIVFYTLRLEGLFLLFLFFGGGTIIGRISKKKRQVRDKLEIEKKGNRRDWVQVFANGFMALIASLLYFTTSNSCALVMFGAAVAEATSDTCSGDIGKLSSKNPVSIRTFTPVPRGLSGGITALGIFSGFISSSVIAITWGLLFTPNTSIFFVTVVGISGFLGCIIDSLLGAYVQAQYKDPESPNPTEHDTKDGVPLELIRGIRWMDNDMVNLISNILASMVAYGVAIGISKF